MKLGIDRLMGVVHPIDYDWWTFPVDEISGHGTKFTLTEDSIVALRQIPDFLRDLDRSVHLLCTAWGWDLHASRPVANPAVALGQSWSSWPVRLYKAGRSLQVFERHELFAKLRVYGIWLRDTQQCNLHFRHSHLKRKEVCIIKSSSYGGDI